MLLNVEGNKVEAIGTEINNSTSFDLIPINTNQIIFRAASGKYLRTEKNGKLAASAEYMRQGEKFNFSNQYSFNKPIQINHWINLLKKRILYLKSKILKRYKNLFIF